MCATTRASKGQIRIEELPFDVYFNRIKQCAGSFKLFCAATCYAMQGCRCIVAAGVFHIAAYMNYTHV